MLKIEPERGQSFLDKRAAELFNDEQPEKLEFELIKIKDIIANPVNVPWLIKGVLESGGVSLISGAYGSGKSFVAFDMAFCISAGIEWHGNRVLSAPVVVLAGEGHSGIGDRFEALTLHYGEDCPEGLYLSKTPARLTDRHNAGWVKQAVDAICPDAGLIVIDTLNRNMGDGDENSSKDMSVFINSIDDHFRQSGKTVLIIHHTGHAEVGRARGSSVLPASCEGEFIVKREDTGLTFECKKQKNAKKPEDMIFNFKTIDLGRIDEDGEAISSLVLEHTGKKTKRAKKAALTFYEAGLMETLKTVMRAWGTEPPDAFKELYPEVLKVVHLSHWKERKEKNEVAKTPDRQQFYNAKQKLLKIGLIGIYAEFVWLID